MVRVTGEPTLIELRVRNLGVIDDVTIALGPGMTALTGETGAGKTLVVEALALLLGGRADPGVVRSGADEALVEGRFAVGPDERDEVLLARAVVRNGRSKAWIDGRMATVAALSERARDLAELHGQHQHQALVHTDAQRRALDAYGRIDLSVLEAARSRLRALAAESEALGGDARERAREVDLLRYQIDEIDQATIEGPDEDRRLEAEEDRLAASDAHRQAAATALDAVSGAEGTSALDQLAEASQALAGRGPLADIDVRVRSAMADLSDLSTELRGVVETWEDDPARLEEVRGRRQLFHQLYRKYGDSLGEVLDFAAAARRRLEDIAAEEQRTEALDEEVRLARVDLASAEAEVAALRRAAAPRLAGEVEATLHTLAMETARFAVAVEGPGAGEEVTFLLGANTGEPLQALAKAASGGELARTMLAVRLAISQSAGLMFLDEVVAGVGGSAATAVGSALAGLGERAQVVVVTHLAQVAAQADQQLEVRKSERNGRTRSTVVPLDREGRVTELSRMLSGHPDSGSARQHAAELLDDGLDGASRVPDGPIVVDSGART
jgi:DNA repair protein RecN (Recombination protein N)